MKNRYILFLILLWIPLITNAAEPVYDTIFIDVDNQVTLAVPEEIKQFSLLMKIDCEKKLHCTQVEVDKIKAFIKPIKSYSLLSKEDKEALGSLFAKLGGFYLHVKHQPQVAMIYFHEAAALFVDKTNIVLNNNHLAMAYGQQYSLLWQAQDKANALYYSNKTVGELIKKEDNQKVQFEHYLAMLGIKQDPNLITLTGNKPLYCLSQGTEVKDQWAMKLSAPFLFSTFF